MSIDDALRQRTVTVPAMCLQAVTFTSVEEAVRHLLDHLLTAPECAGWACLLPDWAPMLDDTVCGTGTAPLPERTNYRQRLAQTEGASGQELFDCWVAELERQSLSAGRLGWWTPTGDGGRQCLGIHAVRLIFQAGTGGWTMTTAYLVGQGDAAEVTAARAEQRLRHDRDRSRPRRGRRDPQSKRDQREQEQREAGWSPEERFYYRCFRPALRELRRAAYSTGGLPRQVQRRREQDRQALWETVNETRLATCEEWRQLLACHYPRQDQNQEQEAS